MDNYYLVLAILVIFTLVGVLIYILNKKQDSRCIGCEIYENPDSDYTHCFSCEKASK